MSAFGFVSYLKLFAFGFVFYFLLVFNLKLVAFVIKRDELSR